MKLKQTPSAAWGHGVAVWRPPSSPSYSVPCERSVPKFRSKPPSYRMTCCMTPPSGKKLSPSLRRDRFRSLVVGADGDANHLVAQLGSGTLAQRAGGQRAHCGLDFDDEGLDGPLPKARGLSQSRNAHAQLALVVRLD